MEGLYTLSSVVASDLVVGVALVSVEVEDPQQASFSSLKDDHFIVLMLSADVLKSDNWSAKEIELVVSE